MIKKFPNEIPLELVGEISSLKEEYANMISHGIGLVLYVLITPYVIYNAYQSNNNWYLFGATIFCISLLMVYISSTWYHSCLIKNKRQKLRIFDHISIYFLIAGSYTPFIFCHFQDSMGTLLIGILWSMVIIGTIFKLFFTHRFNFISTLAYLIMGWQAIFIIDVLIERLPFVALLWIIIGGLFYSIGVVFYLWERLKFNHLIWHLFVLGGSTSHLIAVIFCLH